jgi:hypothetical protein
MEAKFINKTKKNFIVAMLFLMGQQATFAVTNPADTTQTKPVVCDSTHTHCDSTAVKPKKNSCCEDTTVTDHTDPYHKIVKEKGSVRYGLFTVRHIKDDWYLEVPDSLLGRMMLAVTRFTSTPQGFKSFSGEEVNHSAIYLEQYGQKSLFMREYVQSHLAKPEDRIAISLKQSTADPIVYKFDVIGRNPKTKDQLINITKWLMSDNKISSFTASDRTSIGVTSVQNDRTFIDTIKTFPINVEIQTLRTYGTNNSSRTPASTTGSVTLALNTSIVLLPEKPMQPRYFDNRVGYFNNTITEFSDDQQTTNHEAIISRYRLEPKDLQAYKAGKLVEPKKQIVYYIDPATPKKWVKYLIAGINDWNVAFEAAGFKNAIIAKEFPENDTTMSVDDARFSMIRYLPSETENAYGPRIVDPRSGEIIEAHICWYHNVMNLLTKWYMVQCGAVDKRAQTMKFDEKLMGELIRFVSSHEVGHSLGLRHNMGASFATPVEKLRDKAWVEKNGHTASIMDYARFNYVAQPEDKISEKGLFPRINDYDKWAIKWGYQWRPDFKDEYEEKEKLMTETTNILRGNQRLWFGGEGRNEDPRAQTEDLSDNNVKASEYGIKNLKRVIQNLPQWTKQENDQYDDLREMHKAVTDQFNRYMNHVAKNIGGRFINNMPGTEPYAPVPVARQREALQYLGRNIFDAPEWLYPTNIMSKMSSDAGSSQQTMQTNLLTRLMTPLMLSNIGNTEYSVAQYLDDLFAEVWKSPASNTFQAKARRQLQRSYVQNLNTLLNPSATDLKGAMAQSYNSDAMLYVLQNLKKVEDFCQQQMKSSDGINALHYEDLLREIKLIRDRRTTVK